MVEDPLAEALLIGRFKAADTIVVDRSPDAGLTIEPLTEKMPGRGGVAVGSRHGEQRVRLSVLRHGLPTLGGPLSRLRGVELARRDRPVIAGRP